MLRCSQPVHKPEARFTWPVEQAKTSVCRRKAHARSVGSFTGCSSMRLTSSYNVYWPCRSILRARYLPTAFQVAADECGKYTDCAIRERKGGWKPCAWA